MDFLGIKTLITAFTSNVVQSVGYLFMTMAVVAFFWGIVEFIWASRGGESKGMENGKQLMLWGLIALFVMFSVWGIIKFAQKTLGGDLQETTIKIPRIDFGDSTEGNNNPLGGGTTMTPPTGSNGTTMTPPTFQSGTTMTPPTNSNGTTMTPSTVTPEESQREASWYQNSYASLKDGESCTADTQCKSGYCSLLQKKCIDTATKIEETKMINYKR